MNPFLSKKFRFYSFISMVLLVFVHGYNLHERYMQPWSLVGEPLNFTTFTEYFIANGLVRFRIPMLFVISGYLFALHDNTPHWQRIRKRARTLLLPYFIWSVIGLLVAVAFAQWDVTSEVVHRAHLQPMDIPFSQYTWLDWLGAILWPTSFQLWFLRCLFMYNLMYRWLHKGVMKAPWVMFLIFGFLWLTTFGALILEGEGLLFFTLGIWLCKKNVDVNTRPSWLNLPVAAIALLVIAAFKTWLAFKVPGLDTFHWLVFSLLHKSTIFLGLLVAWYGGDALVRWCMDKPWFVRLSSFSFIIYALHVPMITYLIDPSLQVLACTQYARIIGFFALPMAVITVCVMVGYLLRSIAPKVYSVLTGGRGF